MERVTRFVHSRGLLFADGSARWKVFEPSKRDGTTSVFVVDGLDNVSIWELDTRQERAVARADVSPGDVRSVGLGMDFDNDPPRHAAIVTWPDDKAKLKNVAQMLAAKATTYLRPADTAEV